MSSDVNVEERWRPVVGYEGFYEVSDMGRVRSLDRVVGVVGYPGKSTMHARGKMLLPNASGKYPDVHLYLNDPARRRKTFRIHVLVAEAFLGPRPAGLDVCHGNGDSHDNRLVNLRYDTRSANCQDRRLHGTYFRGFASQCLHGHAFDAENTAYAITRGNRQQVCKTCRRQRDRARYWRAKAKAAA